MSQPQITPEFRPAAPPPPTSGKATTSLILGLLSLCLAGLAGVPAIVVGWLALGDIKRSQGTLGGRGLAFFGIGLGTVGTILTCCAAGLAPAVLAARQAAARQQSQNHLKLIAFAMQNYHDVFQALPMPGSEDPALRVQMSWRVRLLPFLEHKQLSDQVNFSEPWDSPGNSQLLAKMPKTYVVPPGESPQHETSYLIFTSDKMIQYGKLAGNPMLGGGKDAIPLSASIDGTANTIMVVEADRERAVPWMKPADLVWDPKNPKAGLGHLRGNGFNAVMGDGHTRFISNSIDDDLLRRLILRDDGQAIHEF